ncbi:MAG: hypothetical protein JW807_00665 [Spirochaetes bacterium]|nr:hypothetical protein [Spirochaetota bacterium]
MKHSTKTAVYRGITRRFFVKIILAALSVPVFSQLKKLQPAQSAKKAARKKSNVVKVYMVRNGDCFQNISRLFRLMGGIAKYIDPTDIVVIKGNAQWPNQGYTHTGCIKAVIDEILRIPKFSGEILICDNIQNVFNHHGIEQTGFGATPPNRKHNWPEHNWESLAAYYRSRGKKVAVKQWKNSPPDSTYKGPADGEGWVRDFFSFHDMTVYLSYPVFKSPLTSGRMIDMKKGVWERGKGYTGRTVKTIFMPTLNNHDWEGGKEDYAGVTSAIKSFFGATEIHIGDNATIRRGWTTCHHMHSASYTKGRADYAGELTARYIQRMYAPVFYITAAMWSGHHSRMGAATETRTVLACENPATLDYVACKHVISPHAPWLDPDRLNNTRKQILGCIGGGIGTINPKNYKIVAYDFSR